MRSEGGPQTLQETSILEPPPPPVESGPAILGLDNVRLDLPLAGIGSRTLAASVDHFLLLLLQAVWMTAGLVLLPRLGFSTAWLFAVMTLGYFLLQWSYFAAFEIAMEGRTPGKLAVGLRVVSQRGGRPTKMAILVRNFLRTLDILLGIPIMAHDPRSRRLGDLVAGTLVVHHRDEAAMAPQLGRHPAGWGAREVSVLESFLNRAEGMESARAHAMAERLLGWIVATEPKFWSEIEPTLAKTADPVHTLREALSAG